MVLLALGISQPTYGDLKAEEKYIETKNIDIRCNCFEYVKFAYFPSLPRTSDILNNLQVEVGDVAVFFYPKSGLHHYARVIWTDGFNYRIDEANFSHCQLSQRDLTINDPHLLGFFNIKGPLL